MYSTLDLEDIETALLLAFLFELEKMEESDSRVERCVLSFCGRVTMVFIAVVGVKVVISIFVADEVWFEFMVKKPADKRFIITLFGSEGEELLSLSSLVTMARDGSFSNKVRKASLVSASRCELCAIDFRNSSVWITPSR